MELRFDDRVVLVTGAARGIGEATARTFATLGARVALLDVDPLVHETARTIAGDEHECRGYVCDVSSSAQVAQSVAQVVEQFGGVDVLVSNAAIQKYGDVVSTTEELWDEVMATNLKGYFLTAKAVIPYMLRAERGSIVAVGSVQSVAAVPNSAAYVTAKHALLGLTRSIAVDYARRGIRANCVCPGSIDTPMLRWAIGLNEDPEKARKRCDQMHALGRIGTADEVANAIAFLGSDAASFITGAALFVDGGMLVPAGGMPAQF